MVKITFDIEKSDYDKLVSHGIKNGRKLAPEVRFGIKKWIEGF